MFALWTLIIVLMPLFASSNVMAIKSSDHNDRRDHHFYEYIIIGAGPAGLQLGYLLRQANRDYVILERDNVAGGFFKTYPRHDTLISINKRHTGRSNREFNLRHDWNSLLSHDETLLFKNYSKEMFPNRTDLLRYLSDYARILRINVLYERNIRNITRINESSLARHRFIMNDQHGTVYSCRVLIIATGWSGINRPKFEGQEHVVGYESVSTRAEDFEGQSVLILGRGNSAFEVANRIYGHTNHIHMLAKTRVRLSWSTHYVGDLRAVNNALLDTYQLKSLDGILEGPMEQMRIVKKKNKLYLNVKQEDYDELEKRRERDGRMYDGRCDGKMGKSQEGGTMSAEECLTKDDNSSCSTKQKVPPVNSGDNSQLENNGVNSQSVNSGDNSKPRNGDDSSQLVNNVDSSKPLNSGDNSQPKNSDVNGQLMNSSDDSKPLNIGDNSRPTETMKSDNGDHLNSGRSQEAFILPVDNFPLREPYDQIIRCLGFNFDDSIFNASSMTIQRGEKRKKKFPLIGFDYQSADVPDLYFAGTLTHSLDFRKAAGGFIHGFRYTARALHHMQEWKYHEVTWPSLTIPITQILPHVLKRMNEASGIYQMFSMLGDVIAFDNESTEVRYVEEFPINLLHEFSTRTGLKRVDSYLVLVMQYGRDFSGPNADVFRSNRAVGDPSDAHLSNFLHPVLYYYDKLLTESDMNMISEDERDPLPRPTRLHHVVEDFLTSWNAPISHLQPLRRFIQYVIGRDLRYVDPQTCMELALTRAGQLPAVCEDGFLSGNNLLHVPGLTAYSRA